MNRDVAIRAARQEQDTHVRVLIRRGLRVRVDNVPGAMSGEKPASPIRDVICTLNGRQVVGVEAGPDLNEEAFFAFVLRDVQPGAVLEVAWTDTAGDSGRGKLTLT
jgi:hypothetical protein